MFRSALRRPAAVLTVLAALMGSTLTAGPGPTAFADDLCGLERSAVHHSEGLDTWNTAYPQPVGTLDAVMLFLSFPDSADLLDPDVIAADYFPATTDFFTRASYGRFELAVDVVPRWTELPVPSTHYAIQRDWDAGARTAYLRDAFTALAPLADLGAYDVIYLVADPDAPGVDSDATKVVNFHEPLKVAGSEINRVVTLFEQRPPDRNVLAHETGHVFDLPDLYNRPSGDTGDWDTHVGDWDLMGSQFGLAPEPFGWHKWKLGWLGAEHVDCVRVPGTTRHTLQPLTAPLDTAHPAADTRIAVVRTGRTEVLVAEARTRDGNDRRACTEGVLLYTVRSDIASAEGPVQVIDGHPDTEACTGRSVHPRLADAPLGTGESYHDAERGVRVEVGDRTPSGGWNLKIVKE
ncbi:MULTISPECIES: M6 family metalloprotease domain-containing protein [Streptomyces]|uniref:M6 family metalloprotease domain-containing protein n=1 Tax=Streptomyces cheonanensis TaxID=312720 RepID=A0ABN2V7A5_9ACTN|nr:M6 family metalloprotease domain-containing protein [Streptomyces harbinensis]QKV70740.1 M6 family metalloprotease domain-containing protein [Streptomyces harbinensis]